jgi:hypothetical protein
VVRPLGERPEIKWWRIGTRNGRSPRSAEQYIQGELVRIADRGQTSTVEFRGDLHLVIIHVLTTRSPTRNQQRVTTRPEGGESRSHAGVRDDEIGFSHRRIQHI